MPNGVSSGDAQAMEQMAFLRSSMMNWFGRAIEGNQLALPAQGAET